MKRLLLLCLLPFAALSADEYELDPGHTFPSFAISHMGYSVHTGRFNETRGSFVMDKQGDGSRLEVIIKTASVDTGSDKLEEKLRGEEFFNVEKFPEMSYRSSTVRWTGENSAEVQGELTLLGVTRPVPLRVTSSKCSPHPFFRTWWCGFAAEASLKRSDFGMKAGIPMVGDEVKISIQAEARRKDAGSGPRR